MSYLHPSFVFYSLMYIEGFTPPPPPSPEATYLVEFYRLLFFIIALLLSISTSKIFLPSATFWTSRGNRRVPFPPPPIHALLFIAHKFHSAFPLFSLLRFLLVESHRICMCDIFFSPHMLLLLIALRSTIPALGIVHLLKMYARVRGANVGKIQGWVMFFQARIVVNSSFILSPSAGG